MIRDTRDDRQNRTMTYCTVSTERVSQFKQTREVHSSTMSTSEALSSFNGISAQKDHLTLRSNYM